MSVNMGMNSNVKISDVHHKVEYHHPLTQTRHRRTQYIQVQA